MMMAPRRWPQGRWTEPASPNPDEIAAVSGIENRGVRSTWRISCYPDRDRKKGTQASIERCAESDDPPLIVDPIRDIQRRKPGLPQVNCRLSEIKHLAVRINEGSFLSVAIAFSDNLSPIAYRSSSSGLGKSVERAEILHRGSVKKKGARASIVGLAIADNNPATIYGKRLAVPAA
jgi:hypothetical protein